MLNGSTGCLCEPTPHAFATAMKMYSGSKSSSVTKACLENAERFGIESFASNLDRAVQ